MSGAAIRPQQTPLAEYLRDSIKDIHENVGHSDDADRNFMARLMRGCVPLDTWRDYIAQKWFFYDALESALRELRESHPEVESLLDDDRFHAGRIGEDIRALGADPGCATPSPATAKAVAWIQELRGRDPILLLGVHYVLEGSTNGGRMMASVLQKIYQVPEGRGISHMNPYDQRGGEMWRAYRLHLNSLALTDRQVAQMGVVARKAFEHFVTIANSFL